MVLQPLPDPLPDVLVVRPWVDPVVEAFGFEPRSVYIETCWLPVLGPSATWLYRRLGQLVRLDGMEQAEVDMVDLSISLGLGRGVARNSPLARTLFRMTRFEVAKWQGRQLQLAVRRALAPLTQTQLRYLSLTPRRIHNSLTAPPPEAAPSVDGVSRRWTKGELRPSLCVQLDDGQAGPSRGRAIENDATSSICI